MKPRGHAKAGQRSEVVQAVGASLTSNVADMVVVNVRKVGAVGGMLALAMMAGAAPVRATPEHVVKLQQAGELMPYEVIQRRVMQNPPGEYIGSQFDAASKQYRFRFMRDGNVINVDVDARTGERVQRRQNF